MQDLKFHLQDVHCVNLRRGCKRSSPDFDADPIPVKTRMSGDAQRRDSDPLLSTGIKREFKFVDESPKLSAKEFSRSLSVPTTSTGDGAPSLNSGADSTKSGSDTPVSSACSFEIEKIDPRLLANADSTFLEPRICNTSEFVDLTGTNEELTPRDRKGFLEDEMIAHGMCS